MAILPKRLLYATSLGTLLSLNPFIAFASGKLYYGSRAGMQVTIVSMSGLDTAHAVIRTKHTRDDAIAYCREYVGKVTKKCIQQELDTPLNDQIRADCPQGMFTNFVGTKYQYMGRNRMEDSMAKYVLMNLETGEIADGSSASGYSVNMDLFQALCPTHAPVAW